MPSNRFTLQDNFFPPRGDQFIVSSIVLWLALAGAVLSGLGIAVIGTGFILAMVALIGGAAILFLPISWVFWLLAVLVFLVVGQLQYFAGISKAFWIPYLLGLVLYFRLLLNRLGRPIELAPIGRSGWGILIAWSVLLSVLIFSSLANRSPFFQLLVSAKEHLFLWSLVFVVASGLLSQETLNRFWHLLLWLAPLQLPAILYQRFVIAPRRAGGASWDAVVGLFGGDPDGGGASAAMAISLIFLSLLAISLWRAGKIGWRLLATVVGSTLISITLAEVKAALVLLPLSVAFLYWRELFRRPLVAGLMVSGAVAVSAGVLAIYQTQYSGARSAESKSLSTYLDTVVTRTADSQYINYSTGEMGRVTALRLWWDKNDVSEPIHLLIGHGMGSSRMGQTVVGDAARKFGFRIDRSSMAIYLWETGLLGMTAVIALLGFAIATAARVARQRSTRTEGAVCAASAPFLVMVGLLLPYNTDFANVPTFQFLMLMVIGQAIYASRACPNRMERT